MQPLVPAVSDYERLGFCLFLALVVHGMGIFGVAFSPPRPGALPDFEVIWTEGLGWPASAPETGEREPWPSHLRATSALAHGLDAGEREVQTLEQEYVRQWIERTERLGDGMVRGLNGEVVVHVMMDAKGMVRQVDVEPGPASLTQAARRIVMQSQPHAPFPELLRMQRDGLQISRRWLFGESVGLHMREPLQP